MSHEKGFDGQLSTGVPVRDANMRACMTIGNIMKSSLGPQGLDKLIVDELGEVTITNDGATILKKLEVSDPIARLLVELSTLQDSEVGDGTTSVVVFAAELIQKAHGLMVKGGIHPTSIIQGYKLAVKEALRFMNKHLTTDVQQLDREILINIAKTSMSSKLLSMDAQIFADISVRALESVANTDDPAQTRYPVGAINIIKCHGKSLKESYLMNGYALQRVGRAAQGMPTSIKNAKIALIDFPLKQHRAPMGVSIEITDAAELEKCREKERDICRHLIEKILESGANVILSTQGLDDMALKYLVDAGVLAVRRVTKLDMKRIAKCTGGTIVISMSNVNSDEEKFERSWLGEAKEVREDRLGDWDMIVLEEPKADKNMTLVLRGANEFMLDEAERSIHDSLCVVSRTMESKKVVAGGGCSEVAMSCYLDSFSRTLGSKEQSAIKAFSESLLAIPKILAQNAALDSSELVPQLRAAHTLGQKSIEKYGPYKNLGLDLVNDRVVNCMENGVIEPSVNKRKAVKYATEAAITILRINDIINLNPEQDVEMRRRAG